MVLLLLYRCRFQNFLNNLVCNIYIFCLYHAQIQSDNIYFFENFRRGTSKLKKIKTSLAPTMYGTIDILWLIEAIFSILMKILRWSRKVSHLFLRIRCIVDDIVHFILMRGCINNYPHPVCGIDRYQIKKNSSLIITLFSIHFIHLSTNFFFQSQNSVYIFSHISLSRSLCPWPMFCPSWEYYFAGFECRTSSFAKSTRFSIVLIHAE